MTCMLPTKNLIRLNWLLVITFTAIVTMYLLFLMNEEPMHKFVYSVLTALGFGSVAFANVGILVKLSRKYPYKTPKFRLYRLVYTYAASAVIYLLLLPLFDMVSHQSYLYPFPIFPSIFIISSFVVNTIIILMQDFVMMQSRIADSQLEFAKMKTAHAEGTILLLKQQIHPHFLFNALNTLKALYRKDQSMADTYIVHLANFLRASVYDHASKTASVENELALLTSYLEMQKIRFGAALNCTIDVPDDIRNSYFLPAFSLQPLLENAIKHNEFTLQSPLNVKVFCDDEQIIIVNNLQKKTLKTFSANHGLSNLAERYRLLSGDEIVIKEDDSSFCVGIRLLSKEYNDV